VKKLGEEFDLMTQENACKMYTIAPSSATTFKWDNCDMLLDFAKLNKQIPKFHVIIWAVNGRSPSYTDSMTPTELESFMYSYVD
jgi:GH35 family endo-1,4-beta-xylanase